MISNLRKPLAVALGVATLLAAEAATAVAQPADSSPVQQLRRDTAAIHALGVSGVQARVIASDGRQSVATSGTENFWAPTAVRLPRPTPPGNGRGTGAGTRPRPGAAY